VLDDRHDGGNDGVVVNLLQDVLDALGSTPEEIARTLQDKGIRGVRKSKCACPIAHYLQLKGFKDAEVGAFTEVSRVLSDGMRDFIYAFDRGEYPELEEK
jgi:hypothetical protein